MPNFRPEKTRTAKNNDVPQDQIPEDTKPEMPNAWDVLAERKKKGLWNGEVTTHKVKRYKLNKGAHYYVIEDYRSGSVKCISCPVSHGGILENHMLTRYEVKDGVIYLDGVARNKTPKGFDNDEKKS